MVRFIRSCHTHVQANCRGNPFVEDCVCCLIALDIDTAEGSKRSFVLSAPRTLPCIGANSGLRPCHQSLSTEPCRTLFGWTSLTRLVRGLPPRAEERPRVPGIDPDCPVHYPVREYSGFLVESFHTLSLLLISDSRRQRNRLTDLSLAHSENHTTEDTW